MAKTKSQRLNEKRDAERELRNKASEQRRISTDNSKTSRQRDIARLRVQIIQKKLDINLLEQRIINL